MEIDDKKIKVLQKLLNDTISNLMYGGSSDPGWTELSGAAACFKTLQILGIKIKNEAKIRDELGGENICNQNFLNIFKIE